MLLIIALYSFFEINTIQFWFSPDRTFDKPVPQWCQKFSVVCRK